MVARNGVKVAEADDLEALVIPSSVKVAGAMLIGAGVTVGIVGLQVLGFRTSGFVSLVGPLALVLSGGCVFAGWGVVRARARSALFALVLAVVTGLFAAAWVVLALMNGVLSPISLLVLPLAATAAILIFFATKNIRKIDAARERLRAQGLDAGL
jgi:hypothetical protein